MDLTMTPLMMLEGLYEEALGLPTDPWKVNPDDGAYKGWNHYVKALKKEGLIGVRPLKRDARGGIMLSGDELFMWITPKGKAEYERVKASPEYAKMKADWESYREAWRQNEARADAAFVKRMKGE
jgi:hypothetical protein